VLKHEKDIDFEYAITVHKAQKSDFEYVMLVLPGISPFIMKELYTAFTRPKKKLYFVIHDDLKEELPSVLSKAYENSSIEQRKTLFGYKELFTGLKVVKFRIDHAKRQIELAKKPSTKPPNSTTSKLQEKKRNEHMEG
jgi:ATP-dependent exoDNAse (exonuclease V) beta subunit